MKQSSKKLESGKKKNLRAEVEIVDKKLEQKEQELAVLYQVTEMVSSLELDKVLHGIVKIATKLTSADSCLVYLLDQQSDTLILRASKNPHRNILGRVKMKLGEGITGWVARERQPVVITENAGSDSRFKYFAALPEDRYEAFLSVPILNSHGAVGVINIQHKRKHKYGLDEINLLAAVGKIVGGAVENARLIEESLALKEALETRKVLEKAKGILMKSLNLSEDDAHRRIQKQSMNMGKSLRDIAEAIILAQEIAHIS